MSTEETVVAAAAGAAPSAAPPVDAEQATPAATAAPAAAPPAPEAAPSPTEQDTATAEAVAEQAAATKSTSRKKNTPKQRRPGSKRPVVDRPAPKINRIKEMQLHDKDVGSTEVQIGLLTDRIKHLTAHLQIHPKDKHTNYGLRKLVSQRKRLLKYLAKANPNNHAKVKATLGMR